LKSRDRQSLIAVLTPTITSIIVVGSALMMCNVLLNKDLTAALGYWLLGGLLIVGYRLFRFYRT